MQDWVVLCYMKIWPHSCHFLKIKYGLSQCMCVKRWQELDLRWLILGINLMFLNMLWNILDVSGRVSCMKLTVSSELWIEWMAFCDIGSPLPVTWRAGRSPSAKKDFCKASPWSWIASDSFVGLQPDGPPCRFWTCLPNSVSQSPKIKSLPMYVTPYWFCSSRKCWQFQWVMWLSVCVAIAVLVWSSRLRSCKYGRYKTYCSPGNKRLTFLAPVAGTHMYIWCPEWNTRI